MTFTKLGLKKPILEGLRAAGYRHPTEIQERAIPLVMQGRDLIGLGETGSGKTAAFGLPLLDRLVGGETGLRALILVPTRELCVQVAESLRQYAQYSDLHVRTAFGGIDLGIQEAAYRRGVDVVVACPGRLIDHLERQTLTLEKVGVVVLDEADRMLDMGFMPQIRRIFVRLPQERQNLLFSATMPPEVESLCKDFLDDPERVQIGARSAVASTITHRFVSVQPTEKGRFLMEILKRESGKVLIFVKRKIGAEKLGGDLKRSNLAADSIHGDKSAEARYSILQAFTRGRIRQLVATDVAARGIDVDDIELVVNFDMPMAVEDYVHRVGRTGRVGRAGRALSLVTARDRGIYKAVAQHLKKTSAGTEDADSGDVQAGDAQSGDAQTKANKTRGRRKSAPRRRSRKKTVGAGNGRRK